MKKRILLSLICLLPASACLWLPALSAAGQAEEVDIVVHRSNSATELSFDDARKIFMCDRSVWPNGKHIYVLTFVPGQSERATIVRGIYKMNETDYAKYFLQAAFTGRIPAPPKEIGTASQMKQQLAQNPSAIGYLKKSDVDDSVKVIFRVQ